MDQTSESEKVHQKQKFDEIIEILLSAGYFRARISTLSEFDKVVGGLCWCMTSSGEDVDVDILFQENSTIGQRIALSEAIVKALRKMNCPSQLQPHQIQGGVGGSEYSAILPVIVWLVKKFFERRHEREAQMRHFSILQFSKNYAIPSEAPAHGSNVAPELAKILARNKAVRSFRCRGFGDDAAVQSEETRVHACLLEYGESLASHASTSSSSGGGGTSSTSSSGRGVAAVSMLDLGLLPDGSSSSSSSSSSSMDLSGFEKRLFQVAKESQREEKLFAEQAEREEAALMQQMSRLDQGDLLSGSQVGAIVGLNAGEIGEAAALYAAEQEQAKRELESNLASGKLGQAAAFKRQRAALQKQLEELSIKTIEQEAAFDALRAKLELMEEEKRQAMDYNAQLTQQIEVFNGLEAKAAKQDELATLKRLVGMNEALKAQEAAFKASCKAQVQDYTARIKALEDVTGRDGGEEDEETQKLRDIEDMHSKVMAKYNRLRQMLAETNLEVANNSRIIDDVPTRSELIQYERRFDELYLQVAWKLEETRKYYDIYNTLETALTFLQKEVKLMNSISENLDQVISNPASKSEFVAQFEVIVKGIEDSMTRQRDLLMQKTQRVEDLKAVHQNLIDQQRQYFKAVKDFQEECDKNEWLTTKLEQLQRSQ